jgi:solute carrier family 45 protein 1/2/4
MICTMFITRMTSAMATIAISGISWSLNLWVPLAIISREIAELRAIHKEEVEDLQYVGETGTLMSIYNIAISAPQILAAGLCSIIFWVLDGSETYDSLGFVLRLGGISSLLAALLIFWLN